jgi:hypothetical protein
MTMRVEQPAQAICARPLDSGKESGTFAPQRASARSEMDEATRSRHDQLNDEVLSAINEVDAALESGEDARQLAAGRHVEELSGRYRELVASVTDAKDTDQIERNLGRRLTDLRRSAQQLTKRMSGAKVEAARDAGSIPFLEQRQPPKSIVPQRAAPTGKLSVGSEIESWCGKCKEMREHHIVAMVGDEPKQVICVVCNSRHGYRNEPPARAKRGEDGPIAGSGMSSGGARRGSSAEEREMQKRQDAKRALQKELLDAVDPKPFDPKSRYKAGEIIVHPEHGRGKIENVLKSSLLVRFLEGLRPLNLS